MGLLSMWVSIHKTRRLSTQLAPEDIKATRKGHKRDTEGKQEGNKEVNTREGNKEGNKRETGREGNKRGGQGGRRRISNS